MNDIVMNFGSLGTYSGTRTFNRNNEEWRLKTGKPNEYLVFYKEKEIIEADTYTRRWCWRNKAAYEKILTKIS